MIGFAIYAEFSLFNYGQFDFDMETSEYCNMGEWSLDQFATDTWSFESPPGPRDELFLDQDSMAPPYLLRSGNQMSLIDYCQESSQSSNQSYSGSAPSSITSYNEHDVGVGLRFSPPQSPPWNRNVSPESMYTEMNRSDSLEHTAPTLECKTPVKAPSAHSSSGTHMCTECPGSRKTFGRNAELVRHISRQHRCPHEDCVNVRFSNGKERDVHQKSVHQSCLGWRCGICLSEGTSPNALAREEKLKDHLRQQHGMEPPFVLIQCKLGSCLVSKVFGGVFFDTRSENALLEHTRQVHGEFSDASKTYSGSETLPGHCSGKRPSSPAALFNAKRWRTEILNDVVTVNNSGNNTKMEETVPLSMMDLRALTKLDKWETFLESLQCLDISATFDNKNTAIKLRSSSKMNLQTGYRSLRGMISGIRTPGEPRDIRSVECLTKQGLVYQTISEKPQPEIASLELDRHKELIALWNEHLLDQFPTMVRKAKIDGSYSVSFVQQKIEGDWRPTIRLRSSQGQSRISREIFREIIEQLCIDHMIDPLLVLFSQGTLVRLARDSVNVAALDDSPLDDRFPHERRYYPKLAMGVSCGIAGCPHVSATAGGFVKVEGKLYMLTVDHLLDACPCTSSDVQSPSISDANNVREHCERKLRDIELKNQRTSTGEIPLSMVVETIFTRVVDEEIEQYARIQAESEQSNGTYAFGTVRQRSSHGQDPHRVSINPSSTGRVHKMDWSLIEVTAKHRKGKNTLRYGRVAAPSLDDLRNEIMRPEGNGSHCTAVSNVNGLEPVHYVGTTSGFRQGHVSAVLTVYEDRATEMVSYEWGMIVPGCHSLRDTAFKGDSGAWIISDNNKLLGQLWGWDDGHLLFTPIVDIFANIAQKMHKNPDVISLPQDQGPKADYQDKLLCRISTESLTTAFENVHLHEDKMYQVPGLLSPITIPTGGRTTRASSWCSIGSIPSLMSSVSTASGGDQQVPTPLQLEHRIIDGIEMQRLPVRPKTRTSPQISVEEWVNVLPDNVLPDGDALGQKLSALQDSSDALHTIMGPPVNRADIEPQQRPFSTCE